MATVETKADRVNRRKVSLSGDDSLAVVGRLIQPGSQVLDLGVASGCFSQALKQQRGCEVDGVESVPEMAEEARPWCRTLLVGDLETERLEDHFPSGFYDAVACVDVLEQLRDPERLLAQLGHLLAENGRILVSIPNIAYTGALLELYAGDFFYRPEGLLSRSHLRFYTLGSFTRMVKALGLVVEQVERVHLRYEESEFRDHTAMVPDAVLEALLRRNDADVYQYVLSLRPAPAVAGRNAAPKPLPIDVVVPVCGVVDQSRRCINSVLKSCSGESFELVVVDDASPQAELRSYLDELADRGRITLLRNSRKLGFTRSANKAMGIHPKRDVVLLSSDTEVYGDWLARLHRAAYSAPKVGTVTPFSNHAAVCSYPRYCAANTIPEGWHPVLLDRLCAEVNRERCVEIPTAVAFCMYITRAGLDKAGFFDAVSFGHGRGEEIDLCLRMHRYGFKHLFCADTFVYRRREAAFGDRKLASEADARGEIERLHPHYARLIEQHMAKDPQRPLRRRLDVARIDRSAKPRLLFVTHAWGGGTERHVQELAGLLKDRYEVFVQRPAGDGMVMLDWAAPGEEFQLYFRLEDEFDGLLDTLKGLRIARIHYHHLIHQDPRIWELPKLLGVAYDFTLHDYYSVCPQVTLTAADGSYCGEPDEAGCTACLAERPAPGGAGIGQWRARHEEFLRGAQRVFGPSEDILRRIERYYPGLPTVLLPHRREAEDAEIRVVILGRITDFKGARRLQACARDAKQRNLPLSFIVLGTMSTAAEQYPELPLFVSGAYSDRDLDHLLLQQRPDLIYFPAQWPEVYSYTLSAALHSRVPIVAPRLGAFEERLRDCPRATLIDWSTPPSTVNELLLDLARASVRSRGRGPQRLTASVTPISAQQEAKQHA